MFAVFCYLFYHSRSSWSSENAADYKKNRQKKGTVSFRNIRHNKMSICVFNYYFCLICCDEIQLAHLPQNNLGLCNLTTCLAPSLLFHPLANYFCCLNVSSNIFFVYWEQKLWLTDQVLNIRGVSGAQPSLPEAHSSRPCCCWESVFPTCPFLLNGDISVLGVYSHEKYLNTGKWLRKKSTIPAHRKGQMQN